jgi:hypothetical protein
LFCKDGFQGIGRSAMAATSVVENDSQLAQATPGNWLRQSISAFNVFVFCILGDLQIIIRVENCFASF